MIRLDFVLARKSSLIFFFQKYLIGWERDKQQ
jgi:hypothetical protein